jgi:hypothetical protein
MLTGVAARYGNLAELAIRQEYVRSGWYVVPAHAIEMGGAPVLIGLIERFVLPDLQAFKPGLAPRWVECKYKDHIDRFQKLSQWQHGIDRPNWYAYLEVEQKTGIAGYLSIVTLKPGRLAEPRPIHLWQSFHELTKHVQICEPHTTFRRGAAYWPIDAFKCSPIKFDLPADLAPLVTNINPWERKSKQGDAPQWPIRFCDESPFERGDLDLPLFRRPAPQQGAA